MVKICKGLDEKDMTKNEATPVWIWRVIRNDFIAKTSRRFAMGHRRFEGNRVLRGDVRRRVKLAL